ncbi:sterol desaturase family protein [Algoriphagus sediminis]|uniref:Sterol desaturase family protein n=1 Tax=Algoriphagus sediminis TaxID=3057113 RepID=A0ABT7YAU3_9BACT|nr:sterol desaturase family protein [Algoriphagus sediminis]MDN3203646.1 sterol desaturase family protein [Algoriphagus sediminis]
MKNTKPNPRPTPRLFCIFQAFLILGSILSLGILLESNRILSYVLIFTSGWFTWTFIEYGMHRFLMHELIVPGKKITLFNHLEHHKSPQHLKVTFWHRVLSVSALIVSSIFAWYKGGAYPLAAGFISGFATFNLIHYVLHQRIGSYLLPHTQRAHILHHSTRPHHGYSFSTTFWDWLFNTLPPKNDVVTERMKKHYYSKEKTTSHIEKAHQAVSRQISIIAFGFLLLSTSCVPVFSDLQSARTLGSGGVEATPYYTNTGNEVSHLGFNFGVGLSESVDIRGKLDHNWYGNSEERENLTVLGIGPKISLVPNRLSFFIPAGRALGSRANETWEIHPTIFYSQPLIPERLELTVSPKWINYLCEDCGSSFATNLGLAYGKDLNKSALRIEYGRILAGGSVGQLSIGYSFNLNQGKNR